MQQVKRTNLYNYQKLLNPIGMNGLFVCDIITLFLIVQQEVWLVLDY